MIEDLDICIALKDSFSQYDIKEFNIFRLDDLNVTFNNLMVDINRNKEICFNIKCPLCGECHNYKYSIKELLKRDMIIGGCESYGIPIFYIGSKMIVNDKINKYNKINKLIYAMI